MGYINKQNRIIDLCLSLEGRRKFAEGSFQPAYYTFGDDNINYHFYYNNSLQSGSVALDKEKVNSLCVEPLASLDDNETIHCFIFDSSNDVKPSIIASTNSITLEQQIKRVDTNDLLNLRFSDTDAKVDFILADFYEKTGSVG